MRTNEAGSEAVKKPLELPMKLAVRTEEENVLLRVKTNPKVAENSDREEVPTVNPEVAVIPDKEEVEKVPTVNPKVVVIPNKEEVEKVQTVNPEVAVIPDKEEVPVSVSVK